MRSSNESRLRLHYCHGLESGPWGYKASSMREWANVVVPDQQMSLWDVRKKNSIARNFLRQLPRIPTSRVAVLRSLAACADVQKRALLESTTDVLIGSSWGGLVASALLVDGVWAGPTVLLCPAIWTMERRFPDFGRTLRGGDRIERGLGELPESVRGKIVLVHGTADSVVPLEDSRRLAKAMGSRLYEIEAGNHGLSSIARSGRLREIIEEVAGRV